MRKLILLALALSLYAGDIDTCTTKINEAKTKLTIANVNYRWQNYDKALKNMLEASALKSDVMQMCEAELKTVELYETMRLEQITLDEMVIMLSERLDDARE